MGRVSRRGGSSLEPVKLLEIGNLTLKDDWSVGREMEMEIYVDSQNESERVETEH